MQAKKQNQSKKIDYRGEILALFVALSASLIQIAHIAQTEWLNVFLFNSDSLTLPIIHQSLARGEAIQWVFSAQLNLFPEGILYAFSSVFSTSISTSLTFNAVLNLIIFYALVRCLFATFSTLKPALQRMYAVCALFVLLGFMLLETYNLRFQALLSYFTFTTYYGGVLISGLLTLYLGLRQLNDTKKLLSNKNLLVSVVVTGVVTLTTVSNPLYVVQFAAPLIAVLICVYLLKLVSFRKLLLILSGQVLGVILGMLGRIVAKSFIGQSLEARSSLLDFSIWEKLLGAMAALAPPDPGISTKIRIYLSVATYFVTLFYVLFQLNKRSKGKKIVLSPAAYVVLIFVAIQPIITVILLSAVNGIQPRYLITSLLLSPIGFVVALSQTKNNTVQNLIKRNWVYVCVVYVTFGLLSIPKTKPLLHATFPDVSCLQEALGDTSANGLSGYWTARALDVYGDGNIRVLQSGGLKPFAWLNNLASYTDKKFTFVVLPRDTDTPLGALPVIMPAQDSFGTSSSLFNCPNFTVMQFGPGTQDYEYVNTEFESGLKEQLQKRQEGSIGDYNLRRWKNQ